MKTRVARLTTMFVLGTPASVKRGFHSLADVAGGDNGYWSPRDRGASIATVGAHPPTPGGVFLQERREQHDSAYRADSLRNDVGHRFGGRGCKLRQQQHDARPEQRDRL